MAISVNWGTSVITVPQSDLLQVQTTPIEVYELNIDDFRLALRDLEDEPEGMPFTETHRHVAPFTISGVTLARVVEILEPYTITFSPNLPYGVNIVGGNSNIADRTNPNNVSVRSANSAGLQDSESLQASSFVDGAVTVDVVNGVTGTTFPRGTQQTPVNNMTDALAIAEERGLLKFLVRESLTLTSLDYALGYTFFADKAGVLITIDPGANVTNCTFESIGVTGVLDVNNRFNRCEVFNATSLDATLSDCLITGTLELGGSAQTELLDCYSGIAGGGAMQYPTVDMGATGNDLLVRDWAGGLGIANLDDAGVQVSIDMSSGRVVVESDVTDGTVVIRGVADVMDMSTGAAVVVNETIQQEINDLRPVIQAAPHTV